MAENRLFARGAGGEVLALYDFNAVTKLLTYVRRYDWFAGKLVGKREDRLGTVETGARFYPYGEESPATGQDERKFATYWRDSNTGLDYAMARYYSSGTGRFLTPDPYRGSASVARSGSWNRYAYVEGDPVNKNDSSGLCTFYAGRWFCDDSDQLLGEDNIESVGDTHTNPSPAEEHEAASRGIKLLEAVDSGRVRDAESEAEGSRRRKVRDSLDVFADCFKEHFGLDTLVSGTFALPLPKGFVPPFREVGSPSTNLFSLISHYVPVEMPFRVFNTPLLFRAIGRVNPWVALTLTAYDLIKIGECVWDANP